MGALLATLVGGVTVGGGEPAGSDPPAAPASPPADFASPLGSPSPSDGPDVPADREIELAATRSMQFVGSGGTAVKEIRVLPGETVTFVVGNYAPFTHNFYIGPREALANGQVADLPGIAAWAGATRTLTWTVPDHIDELWFGCTVPGHFGLMQGRFVVAAGVMPAIVGLPEPEALALLDAAGLAPGERVGHSDTAVAAGVILEQQPEAGAVLVPADPVRYTVSTGFEGSEGPG